MQNREIESGPQKFMQYPNFSRVSVTEGGGGCNAPLMFHCKWLKNPI